MVVYLVSELPEKDLHAVVECFAAAIAAGIPDAARKHIASALRTRTIDKTANDLFIRYLGISPYDGPVLPPNAVDPTSYKSNKRYYQNGREVQLIDPAQVANVKRVSEARCPELVKRYPEIFKMRYY